MVVSVPRYYRGVTSGSPGERDFMSNKALGKDPRGPELDNPGVVEGVSVFDSLDIAKSKTATVSGVTHFAKVVPDGVGVIRKTLGKGHYTWWVDPKADLGTIRRIYP